MKLRISFFDKEVFRKDVTRFAPLWALYFLGGLLVMLPALDGFSSYNYAAEALGETLGYLGVVNMIYALLAAQLLFGDLFQSRLCNALHALPLRRETWFCTHVVSGLAFSAVPHGIAMLLFSLYLGRFFYVALLWALGMLLQYLFFFGLAVFCVFCTGNRFAMAAVYAILNFFSLIVWWFVNTVYIPLLYGIQLIEDGFVQFCPVVQLSSYGSDMFQFYRPAVTAGSPVYFQGLGEGWIYMAVLAALGIGLLVAALFLYRRRALESAGDFMSVKCLAPVFSVVYTLCVAAMFAMFGDLIMDTYVVFFVVGLAVGFYTGQMLLERSLRVFRMKTFGRLALICAVLLGSLLVVWLDPAGVTRWLPEPDQVQAVYIDDSSRIQEDICRVSTPEDIRQVVDLHNVILEQGSDSEYWGDWQYMTFLYEMKDGRQVQRQYRVYCSDTVLKKMRAVFSNPRYVLNYTDWEDFLAHVYRIELDYFGDLSAAKQASFLEAVKADCEAGNMAQSWRLHDGAYSTIGCRIYFRETENYDSPYFDIFPEAENTLRWLEDNGLLYDELKDKFGLE